MVESFHFLNPQLGRLSADLIALGGNEERRLHIGRTKEGRRGRETPPLPRRPLDHVK